MRPSPLTLEQKANFLIGHLDGVAREKVEEVAESARKDFDSEASRLTESPQQKYVARQNLSSCRQEPRESCVTFAHRVLNLVRTAITGQDATQKDDVLEKFVAHLRGDMWYFVKLDNPPTLDNAVTKVQMVEQLLIEATAKRLITTA
uniref:14_3_3 domain-containing protein n=1 Tax=Haemonchus contortus TaxID=6289 RepID=A0A7I4Y6E2_HAECO